MILKNKEYIVDILDLTYEGLGFARIDDFPVFIENALIGERIKIKIIKVIKKYAIAIAVEFLKTSADRNEIIDPKGTWTGTTPLQHLKYLKQLEFKQKMVKDLFFKAFKKEYVVLDTIASDKITSYRNKAQIPVREKQGQLITGFFRKNSHTLVEIDDFIIQDKDIDILIIEIRNKLNQLKIKAYNEENHSGQLRHIVIRKAVITNQFQVILVINGKLDNTTLALLKKTFLNDLKIHSLVLNINTLKTNVIMGDENILLKGEDYIIDELLGFKFKISSKSFYQINHSQTEKLYQKVIEFGEFKKDDVVLDAYCGIGTIGICISPYVKKVYGIEIVDDAIKMAKENARINNIKNCEFEAAPVESVIDKYVDLNINTVVIDPPRKGLDLKAIEHLKRINSDKIIYVSCDPKTLVRDVKLLSDQYEIKEIQPVDMFPLTTHVECIALIQRVKS